MFFQQPFVDCVTTRDTDRKRPTSAISAEHNEQTRWVALRNYNTT